MPKHPKSKETAEAGPSEPKKHAGGPLKRKGSQAEEWDEVIGPSIDAIPAPQLALRIECPSEETLKLAKQIASEVTVIWHRARVPTAVEKNCVKQVMESINLWKSIHNPGEMASNSVFQKQLDNLLDLKPRLRGKVSEEKQLDNLRDLMRSNSEKQRKTSTSEMYNWETDFNFYLDQFQVY